VFSQAAQEVTTFSKKAEATTFQIPEEIFRLKEAVQQQIIELETMVGPIGGSIGLAKPPSEIQTVMDNLLEASASLLQLYQSYV